MIDSDIKTAISNHSNDPKYITEHYTACAILTSVCPGPKMVAVRNYHGTPAPPGKTPVSFQTGDFIELLKGDPDTTWWEVCVL